MLCITAIIIILLIQPVGCHMLIKILVLIKEDYTLYEIEAKPNKYFNYDIYPAYELVPYTN